MDSETEGRFVALETKLAYLEDFLAQLQEVTVEHTALLGRLKEENALLARRLRELSEQLEGDVPNRRPPHY